MLRFAITKTLTATGRASAHAIFWRAAGGGGAGGCTLVSSVSPLRRTVVDGCVVRACNHRTVCECFHARCGGGGTGRRSHARPCRPYVPFTVRNSTLVLLSASRDRKCERQEQRLCCKAAGTLPPSRFECVTDIGVNRHFFYTILGKSPAET